MNPTMLVRRAIRDTKEIDQEYWAALCAQRSGHNPEHLGSFFPDLSPKAVDEMMCSVEWEPYTHVDVDKSCRAFMASGVAGKFGMVLLSDVPEKAELWWDASRDAVLVELVWRGHGAHRHGGSYIDVDYLVAIVGPPGIIYTFHPGDPVKPSKLDRKYGHGGDRHGDTITKASAARHGIRWVKLGTP